MPGVAAAAQANTKTNKDAADSTLNTHGLWHHETRGQAFDRTAQDSKQSKPDLLSLYMLHGQRHGCTQNGQDGQRGDTDFETQAEDSACQRTHHQ